MHFFPIILFRTNIYSVKSLGTSIFYGIVGTVLKTYISVLESILKYSSIESRTDLNVGPDYNRHRKTEEKV